MKREVQMKVNQIIKLSKYLCLEGRISFLCLVKNCECNKFFLSCLNEIKDNAHNYFVRRGFIHTEIKGYRKWSKVHGYRFDRHAVSQYFKSCLVQRHYTHDYIDDLRYDFITWNKYSKRIELNLKKV